MKTFLAMVSFGLLAFATPLRAVVHIEPVGQITSPPGHSYITGATVAKNRLILTTVNEVWESLVTPPTTFSKVFDPTLAGVRMFEDSLSFHRSGADLYLFTGGLFDIRTYIYQRSTLSVVGQFGMTDLNYLPNGIAARDSLIGGVAGSSQFFVSNRNLDQGAPFLALYNLTGGDQTGIRFGISGPGAVSTGVGALAFGPDGILNALDTVRNEILRYDPDTLDYLGAIPLANTTTDRTSFAITPNGYIFTADINGYEGSIYDYATGAFVGTFAGDYFGPSPGGGGKLAMTAGLDGLVYVYNDSASNLVQIYDSTAVPEPSVAALFIGALMMASLRRKKG